MNIREVMKALARPFDPRSISWRVGPTMRDKSKGQVLCYIDARDVMKRLDDVQLQHGVMWQSEYLPVHTHTVICRVGLLLPVLDPGDGLPCDDGMGRLAVHWLWRSSGAGETQVEGEKGATSDAFKRAAVCWGVGRYLYGIKGPWVELDDGRLPNDFQRPELPEWATPAGYDALMAERAQVDHHA